MFVNPGGPYAGAAKSVLSNLSNLLINRQHGRCSPIIPAINSIIG